MKPEFKAIWEEVKANHARLRSCPGPHVFPPYGRALGVKYTCTTCLGTVSATDRLWYDTGLQHGTTICGATLIWVPGEDGFASTCSKCGNHLMGLLESPDLYPVCTVRRK